MDVRKDISEKILGLLCVICIALAGVGDSPALSSLPDGITKVMAIPVIGLAFLHFFVVADFDKFKESLRYIPVLGSLVMVIFLSTLIVFCTDFSDMEVITRGLSKLIFQVVTVFFGVSMVYLFGIKAVDYLFYGMVGANLGVMVFALQGYSIGEAVSSVITCIVTFGEAEGYVRNCEIHDITFLFGQLFLFYAIFAPRKNGTQKWKNFWFCVICVFFILLGLKRISIPAIALVLVIAFILKNMKHPYRLAAIIGAGIFIFAWVYVLLVRGGVITELMEVLGVDMMGRDHIWSYVHDYYEISPFFLGNGFESVRSIMHEVESLGIIKTAYLLHNDYLKVFVELGFWGFTFWTGIQYIFYPYYWFKKNSKLSGIVYLSLIIYMSITYLTDNTAFYFWVSIGLRLIPMAVAVGMKEEKQEANMKSAKTIKEEVSQMLGEAGE